MFYYWVVVDLCLHPFWPFRHFLNMFHNKETSLYFFGLWYVFLTGIVRNAIENSLNFLCVSPKGVKHSVMRWGAIHYFLAQSYFSTSFQWCTFQKWECESSSLNDHSTAVPSTMLSFQVPVYILFIILLHSVNYH